MAVVVWIVYAADRLLDVRRLGRSPDVFNALEARHFFHHRHQLGFLVAIGAATTGLAALLPSLDPTAFRLYCVEGALLIIWLVLLHATRLARSLPKEIAVGIFFAAAVFIPTVARAPNLLGQLLPAAVLFATLGALNCLFIYAWEHDSPKKISSPQPHITTRIAIEHLPAITLAVLSAAICACLFASHAARLPLAACVLSTAALITLHCFRHLLARTTLRAAADLALLTPTLLLPFLAR
jgi:hypothetical protein